MDDGTGEQRRSIYFGQSLSPSPSMLSFCSFCISAILAATVEKHAIIATQES